MRWKTKSKNRSGDTRVVARFALLPTKLSDGYTVWLESYWAVETWWVGPKGIIDVQRWKTKYTSVAHPDKPKTGSTTR